ncbi:putative hydrolase of HD superfamily [Thermocatellispora tengchongensis]|uniref:Putative hydrolase of HD superfamily n=1 Tax=Thermocatellispora tengchongensis TaxID=1073253 RepID=A0A840PIP2_9ACTN|nr:HD domain-containing protein [Thermocatellispora tengchongensis]MBB5137681.1 putative hydrolase of HD superfamily [Thermocatellispora tengchongensis]
MNIAPGGDRLHAQIEFALEIDKLKRVIRRNTLMDGSRRENDAEHSWYIGMLAMVLGEHAPPGTDLDRVVAMLLVHDLVEIDAGDTFVYDRAAVAAQGELERKAADRIFGLLPEEQAKRLRELWEEFEERRTPEARFARALDRFAPMLANHRTEGGTWSLYKVTAEQVLENVKIIEEGSPALGAYAAEMVELSVSRGHLARS